MHKIGFIGGGKIAQAMAKGFIKAGLTCADRVTASCHPSDLPNIEAFKSLGVNTITNNGPVVDGSEVVFVSVKPGVVPTVLQEIKAAAANKLFVSVAMGVTIAQIENILPQTARVIRVMPNTPAIVNQGCSVFVRGKQATQADADVTHSLLQSIGTSEEIVEDQMDAVTALSGSGPAYVFVMIEALADGAVKMGLPRDLAYRLASQTVLGSGQLVRDSGVHPGKLKDDVTSPAGSTASGLWHLEANGMSFQRRNGLLIYAALCTNNQSFSPELLAFRSTVAGAVESATLRCREISKKQ